MNVGIITVSDRASTGEYEDHGGPALQAESGKRGWHVLADAIVPDDKERIKEVILAFEAQGCNLILTTGGTGITDFTLFVFWTVTAVTAVIEYTPRLLAVLMSA